MQKLNLAARWLVLSLLVLATGGALVAALNWTAIEETVESLSPQSARRTTLEMRDKKATGELSRLHVFDRQSIEIETHIGFVNGDKAIVTWDKSTRRQTYTRRSREGKQLDHFSFVIPASHASRLVEVPKERFWLAFETHLFDEKGTKLATHRALRPEPYHTDKRAHEIYTFYPDGDEHTFARYADNGQVIFTFEQEPDWRNRVDTTWRYDGTLETHGRHNPDGSYLSTTYWFDGKTPFEVVHRGPGNLPDLVRTYYRKDGSLWVRDASIRPVNAPEYSIVDHSFIEEYRADGTLEMKLDWGMSNFDLTISVYRTDGTIEKRYQVVSNWGSAYHDWDSMSMKQTEFFDASGKLVTILDFDEKTNAPALVTTIATDGGRHAAVPAAPLDSTWTSPPLLRKPDKAFEAQKANPAARSQVDY